jgi:hypothetical protein
MVNINMYIPTWIIIGLVVVVCIYLSRSKKGNHPVRWQVSTDEIWIQGEEKHDKIMRDDSSLAKFLQDEKDLTDAMKDDVLRLKKRFSNDEGKEREFALMWLDYLYAMGRIISARYLLDVTDSETAFEDHQENVREHDIAIDEIDKKVRGLLGKDSRHAVVMDKIREKSKKVAKAMNEMAEKETKKK